MTKHPSYDSYTLDYDFAILELSSPLSFNAATQAISTAGSDPADGTISTVSGWGETLEGNDDGFLRAVDVPIVSRSLCNSQYAEFGGITDSMICAGYEQGGRDACTVSNLLIFLFAKNTEIFFKIKIRVILVDR